jgi:Flp pilus assembly pilin Flp
MIKSRNFYRNKQLGASLVEYSLLIALIAVVCITVVMELGDKVSCKLMMAGANIQNNPNFVDRLNIFGAQYLCENPSADWGL